MSYMKRRIGKARFLEEKRWLNPYLAGMLGFPDWLTSQLKRLSLLSLTL